MSGPRPSLEAELLASLPPAAADWLRTALAGVARAGEPAAVGAWSAAGRKLGRAPLTVAGVIAPADAWGRAVLLIAALGAMPPDRHVSFVDELYRTGELGEQQALLRALALLPDPERFSEVAAEAVRSNAVVLLEAIACDNAYPAAFLPDEMWNQMVLKALFCGLPLGRVRGLAARRTAELQRMVAAYASERRAAGRPVPEDVALVLDQGGSRASV